MKTTEKVDSRGFSLVEMMVAVTVSTLLIYLGQHQYIEMQKHKFNSEQTIEQKHMQRILFIKMVKRSKDIIWRYFDMDNTLMNDSETLLSKKLITQKIMKS